MPSQTISITSNSLNILRNFRGQYNSITTLRDELYAELENFGRTKVFDYMMENLIKQCNTYLFNVGTYGQLCCMLDHKNFFTCHEIIDIILEETTMLKDNREIISEASCITKYKARLINGHEQKRFELYVEYFDC